MKLIYIATVWFFLWYKAAASNLVGDSINRFVTRIDKILTYDNELTSVLCPFNLHLGLSVLHQGAGGDTAKELAYVLGLPKDKQEISSSYQSLLDKLTGKSFKTWTCMIPGENFDFNPQFADTAYRFFKSGAAGVRRVKNESDGDVMLKYCNNISSRPKTTKLQLFSKAGFDSSWKKSFTTSGENDFYISPGKKVKTMMMTMTDIFPYKEDSDLNARVLKMYYQEEGWGMVLVLPNNNKEGLSSLQSKIAAKPLPDLMNDLENVKLDVVIPKFTANAFNFHRNLKFLNKMGAEKLFSNEADFHHVSIGGTMHLSHVLIEAFIAINETGTLAGSGADFLAGGGDELNLNPQKPQLTKTAVSEAPTEGNVTNSSPGFKANHPFLFYIVGPDDVFLYSGKIVDPNKQTP